MQTKYLSDTLKRYASSKFGAKNMKTRQKFDAIYLLFYLRSGKSWTLPPLFVCDYGTPFPIFKIVIFLGDLPGKYPNVK